MRRDYWDYYRAIEDDLIATSRYVEFEPSNFSCYSIEFARLLLATGSELDMVFKVLCKTIVGSSKADSINGYYTDITGKFPDLTTLKRSVRRFKLELQPFAGWTKNDPPCWWTCGFNKIKHARNEFFHFATLKHTLDAVAALQIALFHLYHLKEDSEVGEFGISELPRLIFPITSDDQEQEIHIQILHFLK